MIKKLKIGLLIAVLSLAVGVGLVNAAAGDLVWSSDQTIDLTTVDLTIESGSTAESMVVNPTTLVPTLANTDIFTVSTATAGSIVVSPTTGVSLRCSSTTAVATAVIAATGGQAYTITPSDTACGPISGGGGGGGGTTTPAADTTAPTGTSININYSAATTSSLVASLTLGATGATQMLISNNEGFAGATWESYATSKTWTLSSGDGVKTVYAKFRDAALNVSATVSDTITVSGSGTVAVPEKESEGCSGGNKYNTNTGAICVNNVGETAHGLYNFGDKTLKNGSKGEAVMELQRFLNAKLNLGLVVDGKLGPKTIAVIKKWQKAHGLVADGLIGPKTKAMMNAEE